MFVSQKTPLHKAVESGSDATVKVFIDKGAYVDIKDDDGVRKVTNYRIWGHFNCKFKVLIERRVCPLLSDRVPNPKNV